MLVVLAVRYLKISTNYNSGEKLQGKNHPLSPKSDPLLKMVYVPHYYLSSVT